MTTISLFPLSSVLLPHGKMPLQIFEQRYLDLVRSSMKTADPFGIVWVRRGSEVAERGRASSELGDWAPWLALSTGISCPTVCWVSPYRERGALTFTTPKPSPVVWSWERWFIGTSLLVCQCRMNGGQCWMYSRAWKVILTCSL